MLREQAGGVMGVILQETHHASQDEADAWMRQGAAAGLPFMGQSAWVAGGPLSRGVAVLFHPSVQVEDLAVECADAGGRLVVVSFALHGVRFRIANVYAPASGGRDREEFYSTVLRPALQAGPGQGEVLLVGGDFNCVADTQLDVVGGGTARTAGFLGGLDAVQHEAGLIDAFRALHPGTIEFTHRSTCGSAARLDRWLVHEAAMHMVTDARVVDGWPGDHRAAQVTLTFVEGVIRGPGRWAMPLPLLGDREFCDELRVAMVHWLAARPIGQGRTAGARWELFKQFVREYCMRHSLEAARRRRQAGRELQDAAGRAAELWAGVGQSAAGAEQWAAAQAVAQQHHEAEARKAAHFAGVLWEDYGESSTFWFHRLGVKRRANTTIAELADTLAQPNTLPSGELQYPSISLATIEGVDRAAEVIAAFYDGQREGGLFHLVGTDPAAQAEVLGCVDSVLSDEERVACEGVGAHGEVVTATELGEALKQCARGKAPGCDGLPYEFYSEFWDVVGGPLTEVFAEAFAAGGDGMLPLSMRQGLIVMVYKGKGARLMLANYRPLTLLCTDYKLMAKALSLRFRGPLGSVVDDTQSAFLPGRWIGDNVLFHLEEIDYLELAQQPGVVAFHDFEKAYDRIERGWVMQCMRALGFGPKATGWVELLLRGTVARCMFNGWRTRQFCVVSGVAQGSPLSPLL